MRRISAPSWVSLSLCVAAINILTNCAVETSNIYIGLYAQELGASNFQVGFIAASMGVAYLLSSLLFGRLSDIHGRMRYIRVGLALTALSFVTQIFANSAMTLLAARSLIGFSLGINAAVLVAYTFENQNQVGSFISFGALGWLLGAVTGGIVKDYHALFIISTAVASAAFFISFFLREEKTVRIKVAVFPVSLIKADFKIYLALFLRQLGGNAIWAVWPLYQASIGATKTWIMLVESTNMVGQIIFMRIIEKFDPARMFKIGLLLSAAVFAAYGFANRYWQLIPTQAVLSFAYSAMFAGALAYLLRRHKEYGTTSGLMNSFNALSGTAGPFLGGAVSEAWGYPTLMFVSTGLTLLGFLTAAGIKSQPRSKKNAM
jgi:MFS transporter, DHA1 family, multidrug resistance protein